MNKQKHNENTLAGSDCPVATCYASLFWRTMDTAPKDSTEILAYKPDYGGLIYMVRWCQPEGQGGVWVQESGGPWRPETEFTHWMPLPPFPSQHNSVIK